MSVGTALEQRSRRRARRRLALEAVVVLGLTAAALGLIYYFTGGQASSPWRAAATHVQNISHAPGLQTEAAVAVNQSNPRELVAASNETLEPEIRVYSSMNGGRTWKSERGPLLNPDTCAWGDPAAAIAPSGRQYVAYTEKSVCSQGPDLSPYLVVASRAGQGRPWLLRRIAKPAVSFGFDDKPAITVARDGTVYVAWSRLLGRRYQTTVISTSRDGGKTWTPPKPVDSRLVQPQLVSLTGGTGRNVYIAGVDAKGIWVGRSANGGRRFVVRHAAPLPGNQAATCVVFGKFVLPQQAVRCLGPNPSVTATGDRVYVTYATAGADGTQDVAVAAFDPALKPLFRERVGPGEKKADQFWPISAVDARTGLLWACFYDTTGDGARKSAWFSCTTSRDGRKWSTPVRASQASANSQVLWADALISGYGDSGGWGGYPGLAVADGIAHPLWIDTRSLGGNQEEVFAGTLSAKSLGR